MELRRLGFAASVAFFVQVVLLFSLASGQLTNFTSKEIYAEGYCSMYGICAKRSDGKVLNCPNHTRSVKPDELLSSKIQSLCPSITGNVCCSQDQFDTLQQQVQQVIPFLVGCPACLRNFLNIFCELSCSPDQSLFINVTSVKKVNGSLAVDGIDFYVSSRYGEQLYNSCKDVKFGSFNSRAMDFVGAGAKNYSEWFSFIGRQANLNEVGSPYAIMFRSNISNSSGMKPMNVTVYSCGDSSLGCSCGDCPSSAVCSDSLPQAPPENKSCSIKIGSLKIKCLRFSLGIVYIFFIAAFLVWDFVYRRKGRRSDSSSNKVSFNLKDNELHTGDKQGDPPQSLQTSAEASSVVKAQKSSVVQDYMARFFRNYGGFVSKHPTLVLCLSLAVPLLLCIGLIHFKVETRPEKLWVGPGSKAAQEKQYFDSHLAPFYRIEQIILSTIPSSEHEKPPGIVTDKNLKLLFELQKKVDELQGNYSGSMVSLKDICLKPLGEECATQSILQYYKMDPSNYDTYGGIDHAEYCFQHYSSTEKCLSAFQSPLDPSTALGGFSGSNYSEATAFLVTYPVNNVLDKTGNENLMAVAWEKSFIRLVQEELLPLVKEQNLTLSFSSESSIQEELKRESTADIITILISYIVMFVYISLMLGDRPGFSLFVSSKVLLGLSGVVLVLLSVLASMGFYSAIGVKSTLIIMEVIPFLVLAVGVDNMCILVHAVKRQPFELPLDVKISNALVEVGPSITLASLSEVLAFAVGAFIPMPACRVFSIFAALAVLLDFLLQVTAFVALIIFDFLRAENHRVDCVPCIKLQSNVRANDGVGQQDIGLLARYMRDVHSQLLGLRGVKIVVIVVFIGFAFVSIVLCTSKIQPGLEQKVVLPRDSYLQGYFDDLAKYLRVGPPLYFVVKDFNYSSESMQTNKICSISQCDSDSLLNEITKASLASSTTYIAKPAASWIDDFLIWLSPEAFSCCRKFINGSYCPPDDQPPCTKVGTCRDCTTCFLHSDLHDNRPSTVQFKEKLPWFLNALPSSNCAKGGKGAYTTNVDLNGYESGLIQASAFRTYHTPLNKQSDYVNALRAARDFSSRMSDSLKMEVFPYAVFYIFFEQYLDIWKTALINIAIGLGAVFVVCLIFTSSLWSSTIILLVLAMIIVDMMGVMAILDIQLNAISVVNLVMSIGIAVEFCVHIMHSFSVSSGDRETRTKMALCTMGASVFSGITLTKLVGVIVLHFSKSEVFVVYYFQMYLALVLIGFLHGLVFLPVVLSICGPPQVQSPLDSDQNQRTSLPIINS